MLSMVAVCLLAGVTAACTHADVNDAELGNVTDVHFIAMMTPHHQQAVDMSDIILSKDDISPATKDLAQRIKVGQQEEIDYMRDLADQWDVEDTMQKHSQHVDNGMVSPSQLAQLSNQQGPEAERNFLKLMRAHHVGAIAMTEDEITNGHHQPLRDAAQKMIDVQTAEIHEMDQLLN